ncbi:hypothetical protein SBV1_820016 [Verrucomicrobia bacterium]|nr:hypothetical protein SBV1_820016 [Verrucomicrobiota bacterium]
MGQEAQGQLGPEEEDWQLGTGGEEKDDGWWMMADVGKACRLKAPEGGVPMGSARGEFLGAPFEGLRRRRFH